MDPGFRLISLGDTGHGSSDWPTGRYNRYLGPSQSPPSTELETRIAELAHFLVEHHFQSMCFIRDERGTRATGMGVVYPEVRRASWRSLGMAMGLAPTPTDRVARKMEKMVVNFIFTAGEKVFRCAVLWENVKRSEGRIAVVVVEDDINSEEFWLNLCLFVYGISLTHLYRNSYCNSVEAGRLTAGRHRVRLTTVASLRYSGSP